MGGSWAGGDLVGLLLEFTLVAIIFGRDRSIRITLARVLVITEPCVNLFSTISRGV